MSKDNLIMVVEDNPINLKLTVDVLEYEGYAVLRAASAMEAMQILKGVQPDLILMDLQLPGLDGLSFTTELKAHPVYQNIPIVALTASAMRGDSRRAFDAGCDGYITKPMDTRKLGEQVASFLKRPGNGLTRDY